MTARKEPTKADLAVAVTKLTEENEALRDLLAAVQTMADVPKPAIYSDRYYWACTDRLSTIAVWAELNEDAAGPNAAAVISGWAKAVRKQAAKPVRYEVHAEPEPEPSGEGGVLFPVSNESVWRLQCGCEAVSVDLTPGSAFFCPLHGNTNVAPAPLCQWHGGEGPSGGQCGACQDESAAASVSA